MLRRLEVLRALEASWMSAVLAGIAWKLSRSGFDMGDEMSILSASVR